MNMVFIHQGHKRHISVLETLKDHTVEGEDSRLWEHVTEEGPDMGLTLQAEASRR